MGKDKLIDLVAVAAIALIGLLTAYVCFGLLQSEATGDFQQYSVGGAIAGALASVTLLSTIYLQIRKSSGELQQLRQDSQRELQQLRENNQELQQKLIRGAPRPDGFDTEVSERQKIVLARPKDWNPRGGIIFEYELPETEARGGDEFRARFRCSYSMMSEDDEAQQRSSSEDGAVQRCSSSDDEALRRCYERVRQITFENRCVESHTSEFVYLGGESQSTRSLKIIAREYVGIHVEKDPVTGKEATYWNPITKERYDSLIEGLASERAEGPDQLGTPPRADQGERHDRIGSDGAEGPAPTQLDVTDRLEAAEQPRTSPAAGRKEGHDRARSRPTGDTALSSRQVRPARIVHMSVICFHQGLGIVFYFDFWDDEDDFVESSTVFNQILASTRLLN